MEIHEVEGIIEGILFASGEPVKISRIAAVIGVDSQTVIDAAEHLRDEFGFKHRGVRILRVDDAFQLCSAPEYADYIRLALDTRKAPQLTQPALEVVSIVAYFQPVTRAYIEQVRGVDSNYTLNLLCERGLVAQSGRLAAPGRPALYSTTDTFLRTFGISNLNELPPLPDSISEEEDGQLTIEQTAQSLEESIRKLKDGMNQ